MKRLLVLIPTMLMTAFLALAFVAPGIAQGLVGGVAPALRADHLSVPAVGFGDNRSAPSDQGNVEPAPQSAAPGAMVPQTTATQTPTHRDTAVATAGRVNCGRMGNGFHGGKHDFVCPNQVFPPGSPGS